MREFFHTVKFKVLVCIFSLLLGFMIYVAISAGAATLPKKILETISAPFVSLSTTVSDWVEDTADKFINADKYKRENEILREQLAEMYSQVLEKEDLQAENDQLKEMLGISEEHTDFQWSPCCSVIARTAGDLTGSFTVNRGSSDGISLYDPVFNKIGLVGIVTELSENYCIISTVLSPEVNVGVTSTDSGVIGIIENDLTYSAQGFCVMDYTGKDSGIKPGEVIVTSGSAFFPQGLTVGTVKEIVTDDNGLSVHVLIEPFVDVYTVSDVFVLTGFDGKGEEEE